MLQVQQTRADITRRLPSLKNILLKIAKQKKVTQHHILLLLLIKITLT